MLSKYIKCPKCGNNKIVKNGLINEIQRYRCKNCKSNFTLKLKNDNYEFDLSIIILYLSGLSLTSIGKMLNVSHVTILNKIKKHKQNLSKLHRYQLRQNRKKNNDLDKSVKILNINKLKDKIIIYINITEKKYN